MVPSKLLSQSVPPFVDLLCALQGRLLQLPGCYCAGESSQGHCDLALASILQDILLPLADVIVVGGISCVREPPLCAPASHKSCDDSMVSPDRSQKLGIPSRKGHIPWAGTLRQEKIFY